MNRRLIVILIIILLISHETVFSQNKRTRDYGIEIGVLKTGKYNAITDVPGVKVGQVTLSQGDSIRTGVTAILPHSGNIFQEKVPAAIYIGNGFGKLAGYTQVKELGNLETPIVLTNTLSVSDAIAGLVTYTLDQNPGVGSVNAVVGETNDGYLNDIRGRHVKSDHILQALNAASDGPVEEGNVGAGTGTMCFQYKGGIGTSSRVIPAKFGGYTVGVLVQTNFGGVLQINGVPIAKELGNYASQFKYDVDGSCMMVVFTDAPLDARNLERLAKRAIMGLAKTGGIASNGSGDYVIAVSTATENRVMNNSDSLVEKNTFLRNDVISPLFLATIEATEEAIINSLFAAESTIGKSGHKAEALPVDKVVEIMKKYQGIKME